MARVVPEQRNWETGMRLGRLLLVVGIVLTAVNALMILFLL